MKPEEYERLQARLTSLQNKKERQPGSGSSWRDGWKDAIMAVKSMVHSEFKTDPAKPGKWIDTNGATVSPFYERYKCSVCGERSDNTNFCPNCGAKMDEKVTREQNE